LWYVEVNRYREYFMRGSFFQRSEVLQLPSS
jgi:hypothetical protein